MDKFIVNEHLLVHAKDGGNGYHGRCKYCGLSLVTDLGYSSWDNTKCVDRDKFFWEDDIPKEILNYTRFKGLIWNKKEQIFIKPYYSETYTIIDIYKIIKGIQ